MFPGTAGHLDYREMFLQRGMIHSGPPRVPNLMVLPAPQPPPFTHTHTLLSVDLVFQEPPTPRKQQFQRFRRWQIKGSSLKIRDWILPPMQRLLCTHGKDVVSLVLSVFLSTPRIDLGNSGSFIEWPTALITSASLPKLTHTLHSPKPQKWRVDTLGQRQDRDRTQMPVAHLQCCLGSRKHQDTPTWGPLQQLCQIQGALALPSRGKDKSLNVYGREGHSDLDRARKTSKNVSTHIYQTNVPPNAQTVREKGATFSFGYCAPKREHFLCHPIKYHRCSSAYQTQALLSLQKSRDAHFPSLVLNPPIATHPQMTGLSHSAHGIPVQWLS